MDARLANLGSRSRLGADNLPAVAGRGSHADDGGIGPATTAGSAGSHGVFLEAVDNVLLVDEASPVCADGVEAAWVDDLVEGQDGDLGVVLAVVWCFLSVTTAMLT